MEKNTFCPVCEKEFFKASNLRRHTKKFHPESYRPIPRKQFAFTCDICGKNFSYMKNYKSHKRLHDPNPPSNKVMKNCPLCDFESDKRKLHEHFELFHEIKLMSENKEFGSFEQFLTWKISIENDTKTNYIRGYTQQTKYYDEVILFVCDRSGHRQLKGLKRNKNYIITKKIGGFCPATIKMMKKHDGSVRVCFVRTHIGHGIDRPLGLNKTKITQMRHRSSLNLNTDLIIKDDNVWQFRSGTKNEIYTFLENNNECVNCPHVCDDCRICIHKYSCSCKDCSIKWNMCVHIHLLCRKLLELEDQVAKARTDTNIDISDLIVYDGAQNEQTPILHVESLESPIISAEEKSVVIEEFSNLLIRCNSSETFREIVSFIDKLKTKIECEQMFDVAASNEYVMQ